MERIQKRMDETYQEEEEDEEEQTVQAGERVRVYSSGIRVILQNSYNGRLEGSTLPIPRSTKG